LPQFRLSPSPRPASPNSRTTSRPHPYSAIINQQPAPTPTTDNQAIGQAITRRVLRLDAIKTPLTALGRRHAYPAPYANAAKFAQIAGFANTAASLMGLDATGQIPQTKPKSAITATRSHGPNEALANRTTRRQEPSAQTTMSVLNGKLFPLGAIIPAGLPRPDAECAGDGTPVVPAAMARLSQSTSQRQ